jgi:murein peptide amidase A
VRHRLVLPLVLLLALLLGSAGLPTALATGSASALTASALAASAASASAASVSAASVSGPRRPAVVQTRVIGHSVRGRPIRAWRVGDPGARPRVVVMATMHGDEPAPRQILRSIRDGRRVHGVDMWLVPTVNPDGVARRTRTNAHGVDLNRNYPWRWADLDGRYESGPRPASEPETRALMRFVKDVRPRYVVSFHQPLHAVDNSVRRARPFARRLAHGLHLPARPLLCGGVCHGTFTQWFNHRFAGVAVTVEYGAHPTRHRMRVTAPRQLIRLLGGRR